MARTPIHPGEILADGLDAIGLDAAGLARVIGVPANRISQIVAGQRNVTADTALRLGRSFGTSADFWINLQKAYELDAVRAKIGPARAAIGPALERIPHRRVPAARDSRPDADRAPGGARLDGRHHLNWGASYGHVAEVVEI